MIAIEPQNELMSKVKVENKRQKKYTKKEKDHKNIKKDSEESIPLVNTLPPTIIKEDENEAECLLDHLTHYQEEAYTIMGSYFKGKELNRLTRHQTESMNHFTNYQMQATIDMFNPRTVSSEKDFNIDTGESALTLIYNIKNLKFYPPQLYENNGATKIMMPQEARLRNFTYASKTTVDLHIEIHVRSTDTNELQKSEMMIPAIKFVDLPIMLKSSNCIIQQYNQQIKNNSGECPKDCGGYFIIKGSEKTVLGQERAAENRIYVFHGKNTPKWDWVAEFKSVPDSKCISPKQIEMLISSKTNIYGHGIYIVIPRMKQKTYIELFVLFRALGVITDKAICEYILLNVEDKKQTEMLKYLEASMDDANKYIKSEKTAQEDALKHIMTMVAFNNYTNNITTSSNTNNNPNMKLEVNITEIENKTYYSEHVVNDINKYYKYFLDSKQIHYYKYILEIFQNRKKHVRKNKSKKREYTLEIFQNELFPHCKSLQQKLYLLGLMTNRLIQTALGWIDTDDRDSYLNKRIELTGSLLNNLFRNLYSRFIKDFEKHIIREINTGTWNDPSKIVNSTNIHKIFNPTSIENGINRALATGDFSVKQSNSSNKVGVAQVLNRLTYAASLSHIRRINTPLEKSGELIAPRKLHGTTYGFLCLAGDVDVLLHNRIDSKKIREIRDGNLVNTVNRETLLDEPSYMYQYFRKMPDELFEITTISGRKIKATADHPFLVQSDDDLGKYVMKKLGDLDVKKDKLIIRHMVQPILDENITLVIVKETDVLEHYHMELLEMNLLNVAIPVYKLKIIARLMGALNTDGHIGSKLEDREYYSASFNVGEEYDVYQLADDIKSLGFGNPSIRRKISKFEDKTNGRITISRTWEVVKNGAFAYFMFLMGSFVGQKTCILRKLPEWLTSAEPSIKREYLSSFQGGDGGRLSYQKNGNTFKPSLGITYQTTHNEFLVQTTEYMTQISKMFQEFKIECKLKTIVVNDVKTKIGIYFENTTENLLRYADVIHYTYCEEKRRRSAIVIEHLKIRGFQKLQRDNQYDYILKNSRTEDLVSLSEKTGLTDNQINKVVSKNKREKKLNCRFTCNINYCDFIRENVANNGCVSIPLLSIESITPEYVYDFTTTSENHSFVASSFVVSNCPVETPEGQSIGVVKNISMMTHITIPTQSQSLYEYVKPYILSVEDVKSPTELYDKVKVFVNGSWVGVANDPVTLYKNMKEKKYKGIVNIYTAIVFDYVRMEIRICNDGGRLTRPVLKVRNNKALINSQIIEKIKSREIQWNDLLTDCVLPESVIEYIDSEEQYYSMIGMKCKSQYLHDLVYGEDENKIKKIQYTHCEIHPSTCLGVLASCIPFPHLNQAPRNTYQCAMAKQAIGISSLNYDKRMDKTAYILNYPTRPLIDTRMMDLLQMNTIPSGCQVHVAIMSYTGYNQEDSILINKGSIDRGLFLATIYHTEKDDDKNIIRDEIIRCPPDAKDTKCMKFGNYSKIDAHGFIPENTLVENRDILIAKKVPIKENRNDPTKKIKFEDQSKIFRTTEPTYVDMNYTGRNGEGCNFAKTRLRTLRKPMIGDKFASRSAQKGTVGNIIPECDMPFTKNGLRPDIILNPHAIPSRMTIAQLAETLFGKILLELGMFGDGTSFGELDIYTIIKELKRCGYESHGNEILYDGYTGEQLETSVFIGPVFYQRLKHMVNDKEHSRAMGPMVNLTRQPAEGRSRDGGFRIGEMERDVMIAHGMSKFCRERMYSVSDKYAVHVCKKCGMIATYNNGDYGPMRAKPEMAVHYCRTCNNSSDFAYVEVPYAYKLMSQELQAINIVPRIITE
jgi:DNA-directed RNA polymerase beta subunit/intein/homing endonuclease